MESTQANPEKKEVEYYTANSQKVHVAEQHLSGTYLKWALNRNKILYMKPTELRKAVAVVMADRQSRRWLAQVAKDPSRLQSAQGETRPKVSPNRLNARKRPGTSLTAG